MGFVVAPGDFHVSNGHAMGNRRAADVRYDSLPGEPSRRLNQHPLGSVAIMVASLVFLATHENLVDCRVTVARQQGCI